MAINQASNAATLARKANVPLPKINHNDFSFLLWEQGPDRWGHIDLEQQKVTEWNPLSHRHETLYQG